MTTKLGGQIVHPKMFPLRSGSKMVAILDFLIFPGPLKIAKIDQKVTKINKRTRQ